MSNRERTSSPRSYVSIETSGGEVAETQRSGVKVDGRRLSSTSEISASRPPSPSAFFQNALGTSPHKWGEDILSPSFLSQSPNSLAVRHGANFGSPNQKLETRRA